MRIGRLPMSKKEIWVTNQRRVDANRTVSTDKQEDGDANRVRHSRRHFPTPTTLGRPICPQRPDLANQAVHRTLATTHSDGVSTRRITITLACR